MSRGSPKFRSKLEEKFAAYLTSHGIKFKYEQGKIKYLVKVRSGQCATCGGKDVLKHRLYLPDFRAGSYVLETKGRLTSAERTKFAAIALIEPNLCLVFQRDNPIRKGSAVKYSDWAKDHGIAYYVGVGLPPGILSALKAVRKYREGPMKQKQSTKVVSTYRHKKSGPVMSGTKAKANGKTKTQKS